MFDSEPFIHERVRAIDASGIRRVFDLGAKLENPVNLSIGQPDFDVPGPVKEAAISAIRSGANQYTQTQGCPELRQRVVAQIKEQFPDTMGAGAGETGGDLRPDLGVLITSGVSGGLMLALLSCVGPGDEVLIPDPFFVMYKHLVTLTGATPVFVDTYPDFQFTAGRIEPLITKQTKMILCNSPSNPTGVVASDEHCRQLVDLAQRHKLLLLSDEIYDEFCYGAGEATGCCPSPASYGCDMLLLRGFSKSYGMTGWRLGFAVGPRPIIEQMTKLQQYSFVCAPSMVQLAGVVALNVDVSQHVEQYRRKRDRVVKKLSEHYELTIPGGAFYAFPKVPRHLGITASEFVEQAIKKNLLIIPGSVFSQRDTHFRISYACADPMLDQGLDILIELAQTSQ